MNPDLMTVRETAGHLRTSPRTVYGLIRKGDLPAVKLGGTWRISRGVLDEQLLGEAVSRAAATVTLPPPENALLAHSIDMLAVELRLLRYMLREELRDEAARRIGHHA